MTMIFELDDKEELAFDKFCEKHKHPETKER